MRHSRDDAVDLLEAVRDDVADLAAAYPERRELCLEWATIEAETPGLADDLLSRPDEAVDHLEDALREFDLEDLDVEVAAPSLSRARVRIQGIPERHTYAVGGYSPSEYINRLIALEGQVVKRTEVQPAVDVAAYRCSFCHEVERVDQPPYGGRHEPRQCPNSDCASRNPQFPTSFSLLEGRSEWYDYQKVRLQQPPEDAFGESETLDFHVHDTLAGTEAIEGGSRVTVVGQFQPVDDRHSTINFDQTVVANEVVPVGDTFGDVDVDEHRAAIEEIAAGEPRASLVEAFAPGVAGYDQVKRALVLQMFGGWPKESPDGNYHRGDSHIYLIGDPGVGKTVLLRAVYEVAPRAALTDGSGSSGAGLTAAVAQDDFGDGQWTIEAGTLVRASGGVAAIDELDKGDSSDLAAMHTALESQEVHVSKAGKNATLPAKTAVLAAGNPTGGHFDPRKELADQVELESPLLSRFDLIYTMRERYEEEKIRNVANIMVEGRDAAARLARDEELPEELASLVEPTIDPDVFSAYVVTARELEPVASDDVKDRMKDWYTNLKTTLPDRYTAAMSDDGDRYEGPPLPVTARKLDACYRLAEASARMRMSETIEATDLDYVQPLIERSLADIGIAPKDNAALGSAGDIEAGEVGLT